MASSPRLLSAAAAAVAAVAKCRPRLDQSHSSPDLHPTMAGRAHKKLLAQQLATGPGEEEGESSSEEEEAPAAPFNPFSLLTVRGTRPRRCKQQRSRWNAGRPLTASFGPGAVQDDEDEGAEEQDSDDEQPSSPEAPLPPRPAAAAAAASGGRKRGGKGKKKGSSKRGGGEDSDEEAVADAKGKAAVDEEDLDAILQELNLQVGCRGWVGWAGRCFNCQPDCMSVTSSGGIWHVVQRAAASAMIQELCPVGVHDMVCLQLSVASATQLP